MKPETLRKRIRMEIAKRDMTQAEIAQALGYERPNFNHALRLKNRATPTYVEMLERAWDYLSPPTP